MSHEIVVHYVINALIYYSILSGLIAVYSSARMFFELMEDKWIYTAFLGPAILFFPAFFSEKGNVYRRRSIKAWCCFLVGVLLLSAIENLV